MKSWQLMAIAIWLIIGVYAKLISWDTAYLSIIIAGCFYLLINNLTEAQN